MKRPVVCCGCLCIAILGRDASIHAQYTFTPINYPGTTATAANNIDNAGRIVGEYDDSSGGHHAFILENGVFTSFDVPGAVGASSGNGLNSTDQVVGWYDDLTSTKAYIRNGGTYTDLNPFAGTPVARAYAINDAGHVAGYYEQPGDLLYRGFVYDGTNYTTLSYPGAVGSQAIGINNSDAIVGYYFSGTPHGFFYSGGSYTTVDYPGSTGTVAQGINDSGQIAGIYFDSSDKDHGFLKTSTGYTRIDYPGAIFSGLVGINNAGQVVGYYKDAVGFHGYLATPIVAADVLVSQNLGASAYSASAFFDSQAAPKYAFNGVIDDAWNAGGYSTQWLEVNLQQPRNVTRFKLYVNQFPDGETTHEVWVSNSAIQGDLSGAKLIHTFSGFTSGGGGGSANGEILIYALPSPVSAQFVQIRTTQSLSWVSWDEVQVFAAIPGDFNADGTVDGADLLAWQRGESPNPLSAEDLAEWKSHFGVPAGSASSGAVPEPVSDALLAVAILAHCCARCDATRVISTAVSSKRRS